MLNVRQDYADRLLLYFQSISSLVPPAEAERLSLLEAQLHACECEEELLIWATTLLRRYVLPPKCEKKRTRFFEEFAKEQAPEQTVCYIIDLIDDILAQQNLVENLNIRR